MEHMKKIVGEKVYLAPHRTEDAEQLYRWRNDLSLTEQIGSPTRLSSVESEIDGIKSRNSGEGHHFGIFRWKMIPCWAIAESEISTGSISLPELAFLSVTRSIRARGTEQRQWRCWWALALTTSICTEFLLGYWISTSGQSPATRKSAFGNAGEAMNPIVCMGSGMTGSRWRFWSSGGEQETPNNNVSLTPVAAPPPSLHSGPGQAPAVVGGQKTNQNHQHGPLVQQAGGRVRRLHPPRQYHQGHV